MGVENVTTQEADTRDLSVLESLRDISIAEARKLVREDEYLSQDRHSLAFLQNDGTVVVDGVEMRKDIGAFLYMRRAILMGHRAQEDMSDALAYNEEAAQAARDSGVEAINSGERVVVHQREFDFNATGK